MLLLASSERRRALLGDNAPGIFRRSQLLCIAAAEESILQGTPDYQGHRQETEIKIRIDMAHDLRQSLGVIF